MKVSVVIFFYNQEKYVRETIESVIRQDYDGEIEISISDDCSTDKTSDIIMEYKKRFPNLIKYYRQTTNAGAVNNFLTASQMCTGDLMFVCGGDDIWNERKISSQVEYLNKNNDCVIVHTAAKYINENGEIIGHSVAPKGDIFENNYICASSVCYYTSFFQSYLKEVSPQNYDWMMEDYPMWLYAQKKGYKIGYISDELVNYRIRSNSITHTKNTEKQIRFEKAVYSVRSYFCENDTKKKEMARNLFYKNTAHIYFENKEIEKFRDACLKIRGIKNKAFWLLSFFPFGISFIESQKKRRRKDASY